jgi:hypothetical protein
MQYFIVKPEGGESDVFIDGLPPGAPADWRFSEGEPLADEFPKNAALEFSANYPDGRRLLDIVNNIWDLLIVSSRFKETCDAEGVDNVEYLPVTILDHRGGVAAKEYYIANVLGSERAIDMQKSEYVTSSLDDGEILSIDNLVVDVDGISADAKLFRVATMKTLFFVRQDLLDALRTNGISGLETYPADGWDGLDL